MVIYVPGGNVASSEGKDRFTVCVPVTVLGHIDEKLKELFLKTPVLGLVVDELAEVL